MLEKNVIRDVGLPFSARIFGIVLALAGCFFAYVYMFDPGAFFPGISIGSHSERFGLYSTGVRILGSVLGLAIALALNSALLLALMLATRVFIEFGDVVVGLVINNGTPDTNTFMLVTLAAVEIFFVALLVRSLQRAAM